MKPYYGIFGCYDGNKLKRKLIMKGTFTPDDLFKAWKLIKKEIDQERQANYYGWRHG